VQSVAKGKKKSKIRTLIKWVRRITFIAGIASAIRKYQTDRNESQPPRV
jgi:hypothetical protein